MYPPVNSSGTVPRMYHHGLIVDLADRKAIMAVIKYCSVKPTIPETKTGFRPKLSDQGPRKKPTIAGTTLPSMLVTIIIFAEYFWASISRS